MHADDWYRVASLELRAIYMVLKDHHPGPMDALNPAFAAWHEAGLAAALRSARDVVSAAGYHFAIRAYVAGFRDNHLNVASDVHLNLAWPGFVVQWRKGRFVVLGSAAGHPGIPPRGAELVECGGRPPTEAMIDSVFPYWGNPNLDASWTECGPWLLLDAGNPWVHRPDECVFVHGERRASYRLQWQSIDGDRAKQLLQEAQFGVKPEFSVREFAPDSLWISLPSFRPTGKAHLSFLNYLVRAVPRFRAMRLIVFDVRGNRGGNSQWGEDILESLFGSAYFRRRMAASWKSLPYEEWRVSDDNEHYLRLLLEKLRTEWSEDSPAVKSVEAVVDAMHRCRQFQVPLCPYRESIPADVRPARSVRNPLTAQIVLLTDGQCGSACLDFVDLLFAMGNVRHVGMETSADSLYGDVRSVLLPSGKSRLTFAMKVHRDRPRGPNDPYVPCDYWHGDISDTAAIEHWILQMFRS